MARTIARVLALVAAGIVAVAPAAAQEGILSVQGSGVVEVVPDIADLVIGVKAEEPTPAQALDATSAAVGKVITDAKRAGIADRDIQTSSVQLSAFQRDDKNRRVTLYRAANTVRVRVRDLPRLGAVLRDLVETGANEVQGLRFSTTDPMPHFDQARRQAVTDATRRAKVLAEAAGRRLGSIAEMTESTWNDPGVISAARAAAPADVPVEPGQIAIRAMVQVKWRLEP